MVETAPMAAMVDTHGVNLRQLEYFVVIAEEGSFTRASERLLVAQPSLSQQIGVLEAELGGKLLERLPRGVRLSGSVPLRLELPLFALPRYDGRGV